MTEHAFLQEYLADQTLSNYSVVIVDEAHQRTVLCDIALAVTKEAAQKRADLRVVVSSATIEEAALRKYYGNDVRPVLISTSQSVNDNSFFVQQFSVVNVPGRLFPVDIVYAPSTTGDDDEYYDRLVKKVFFLPHILRFFLILIHHPHAHIHLLSHIRPHPHSHSYPHSPGR